MLFPVVVGFDSFSMRYLWSRENDQIKYICLTRCGRILYMHNPPVYHNPVGYGFVDIIDKQDVKLKGIGVGP
jgi:hypothetical protein